MKYKIGDIAKILNVSTNTIRRYEEKGYIVSLRDNANGYRYYNEDDLFSIINARLLRKYGFSHEQMHQMKENDLRQNIEAYENQVSQMDLQISYLTYVRHRMKDDLLLMKKAQINHDIIYEKSSVALFYVLYEENNMILTESERLASIQEFLYVSPEVQRIYIIRKSDIEQERFVINMGWAVKQMHMDKYQIHQNKYTIEYAQKKSIMGVAKLPARTRNDGSYTTEQIKCQLLGKHLQYIKEHDMHITNDIIGIVISRAFENGQDMQYILISVPVE